MELNIFLSIGPRERPLMESRLTPPLARAFSCWANVICSDAAEAARTDNFDVRDGEDAEGEKGIGSHIRMHMFAYASSAVSGNRGRGPPATYFEAPTRICASTGHTRIFEIPDRRSAPKPFAHSHRSVLIAISRCEWCH